MITIAEQVEAAKAAEIARQTAELNAAGKPLKINHTLVAEVGRALEDADWNERHSGRSPRPIPRSSRVVSLEPEVERVSLVRRLFSR